MAEEKPDEIPWYAPGHTNSSRAPACKPRPRERLWTLVKAGRRVDAELLYQAEDGVEIQFLFEGVIAYGHRCVLRAEAIAEADHHRERLTGEGWTAPVTSHPVE